MKFNIYDDCENTKLPDTLDGDFKVWDGSGRFHNYVLMHLHVGVGAAFKLMATSEDYRDNENVIRFMDKALNAGDAVATGYYSGTLLQVSDGNATLTTRTPSKRSPDFDLSWTSDYLSGDFASEIEKIICENQIAIAPFQGEMTIFSGYQNFMTLDDVDVEEQLDTVQYVVNNIDTSVRLQNFLGEKTVDRLREAIAAGQAMTP